jgi:hypothetical protein
MLRLVFDWVFLFVTKESWWRGKGESKTGRALAASNPIPVLRRSQQAAPYDRALMIPASGLER